jgi:hypothetical protein
VKLGLTIAYRLLIVIEVLWVCGFIFLGTVILAEPVLLIVGIAGAGSIHWILTSPIGRKLKEDDLDAPPGQNH